jgi:tetratricopeptide (TPR) repeat protein
MLPLRDEQKALGYRSLGILDMCKGQYSSALNHLKEATVLHKILNYAVSEVRDRLYMAFAFKAKGNMNGFYNELKTIEQIKENYYLETRYLLLAGKLYVREGDIEKAERLLEDLSTKFEENQPMDLSHFKTLKGEIELAKGNHDEAVSLFEEANTLRKDNFSLESLAYAYLLKGDTARAVASYEELINDKGLLGWEPQEWWLQGHFQLGKIYEEKGDTEKASHYYQRFLDLWINADEDLPLLIETKARMAKLTGSLSNEELQ